MIAAASVIDSDGNMLVLGNEIESSEEVISRISPNFQASTFNTGIVSTDFQNYGGICLGDDGPFGRRSSAYHSINMPVLHW